MVAATRKQAAKPDATATAEISTVAHFADDEIHALEERALAYVKAGLPLHLCGPAGTGKTTTALRVAKLLGRPIILVSGNAQLTTADLLGRETGVRSKKVVDSYIQTVRKTESETSLVWADGKLSEAMRQGCTFIYDEFSRAPASTNNVLLMPLEERRLVFTHPDSSTSDLVAHSEFRAIFTSNPGDYAGVDAVQDALLDRMITVRLNGHDVETSAGIVVARTGIDLDRAIQLVGIVQTLRTQALIAPEASVRSCVMLATIVQARELAVDADDAGFVQLCIDLFLSKSGSDLQDSDAVNDFIAAVRAVVRKQSVERMTKANSASQASKTKEGKAA